MGAWECRITRRCLADDLNLNPPAGGEPFCTLTSPKPIFQAVIAAFCDKQQSPESREPFNYPGSLDVLHRLDADGQSCVIWFQPDPTEVGRCVWLCYAGSAGPAFDRMAWSLGVRLMPSADDRVRLKFDASFRRKRALEKLAREVLQKAIDAPGDKQTGLTGGVQLWVEETAEERNLVIDPTEAATLTVEDLECIRQAVFGDKDLRDLAASSLISGRYGLRYVYSRKKSSSIGSK